MGLAQCHIKSALKEWSLSRLRERWLDAEGCRQAKMLVPTVDLKKTRWLMQMSRQSLSLMVGILTGHCGLNRHLSLMKVVPDPTCPKCKTRQHSIIWESVRCTGPCVPHLQSGRAGRGGAGGPGLEGHPELHQKIEEVSDRGTNTRSKVSIMG